MKIGILTQPMHWNYGGILQHWALQQVLRNMGHNPVKLEVIYPYKANDVIFKIKYLLSSCKTILYKMAGGRKAYNLKNNRLSLRGVKLDRTSRITTSTQLQNAVEKGQYGAFIVGSDQVWRQEYCPSEIEHYFLSFLSEDDMRPRIAYAASFGKRYDYIESNRLEQCRKLLAKFTAISVREDEGVDIVRKDFGCNAELVLDPTLLLNASDYTPLTKGVKKQSFCKLVAYILDFTDEKLSIVESIAKNKKLEKDYLKPKGTNYVGRVPSLKEWVSSIANAEFVVTDSFHGMVFSIIFRKQFVVIPNSERGVCRFLTLLDRLGLRDRMAFSYENYLKNREIMLSTIDYDKVELLKQQLMSKSMDFLKTSLA